MCIYTIWTILLGMSPVVLPFCTEHSVELSTVSPSGMEYYKKKTEFISNALL